jgi:hypothetical protein
LWALVDLRSGGAPTRGYSRPGRIPLCHSNKRRCVLQKRRSASSRRTETRSCLPRVCRGVEQPRRAGRGSSIPGHAAVSCRSRRKGGKNHDRHPRPCQRPRRESRHVRNPLPPGKGRGEEPAEVCRGVEQPRRACRLPLKEEGRKKSRPPSSTTPPTAEGALSCQEPTTTGERKRGGARRRILPQQRQGKTKWRPARLPGGRAAPNLHRWFMGEEEEAQDAVRPWEAASPFSFSSAPAPPLEGAGLHVRCHCSIQKGERSRGGGRCHAAVEDLTPASELGERGHQCKARGRSSGRRGLPPGRRALSSAPPVLPPLRWPPLFPSVPPDLV